LPIGARSLAPENTIIAAQKAIESGADMWELDVQLTSDFLPIVFHDSTLNRTSDVSEFKKYSTRQPWHVHSFAFSEIQELDAGTWFIKNDPFQQIKTGNIKKERISFLKKQKIPTLKEALFFSKENNFPVNVEIKNLKGRPGHKIVVQKVFTIIKELELENMVLISSFNPAYLYEIKKLNQKLRTALLADSYQNNHIQILKDLDASAYHPNLKMMNNFDPTPFLNKGYRIHVWTVNDIKTVEFLIQKGIRGIFTDFPQIF